MRTALLWAMAASALAGCASEQGGVVREPAERPQAPQQDTRGPEPPTGPTPRQSLDMPVASRRVPKEPPREAARQEDPEEAADIEAGRNAARKKRKRLVVVVHAPWDHQSRLLLDEGLKHEEVRRLLRDTVIVRMDFDAPESRDIVRERQIDTLPRMIFYTPDGKLYDHIKGYNDPEWLTKRLRMPPQPD